MIKTLIMLLLLRMLFFAYIIANKISVLYVTISFKRSRLQVKIK